MLAVLVALFCGILMGTHSMAEVVYVEAPIDTDANGRPDRIYVDVTRPQTTARVPSIIAMSPYAMGGNDDAANHKVDFPRLPQDIADPTAKFRSSGTLSFKSNERNADLDISVEAIARGYAALTVHSVGTGRSDGCPTVGDESETLAGKAVIDWLNGRARAFRSNGVEAVATWADGTAGMTGVSYNGSLPNMIATTGIDGLRAIVPVAAISNWYDYYRANGLVVGPGGYIGEDADVLAKFIVRRGACASQISAMAKAMGREHGDFDEFWRARDYVSKAANVKAAVFIMHGQADWNVKQKHAIQWWTALEGVVPRRMWLHRGGHGHPSRSDTQSEILDWFDRYVKGLQNGVENRPVVEVEDSSGRWSAQNAWPHEQAKETIFYLNSDQSLSLVPGADNLVKIIDRGNTQRLESMVQQPATSNQARTIFRTTPLTQSTLLSGTARVHLQVAVLNRRAANITVAVIDYDAQNRGTIVTRGWTDPQNYQSMERGTPLEKGQTYDLAFDLEPKQYRVAAGHRLGVMLTATDYDYTLRPSAGTEIQFSLGANTFVKLQLNGVSP